jgi:hypothetical protein
MPSVIRLAPSPPTDFSSQAPVWRQGRCGRLAVKHTRVARVYCSRVRNKADMVTSSGTHSRSRVSSPPSAPPSTRWSCFALPKEAGRRPRATTGRHCLTSPPTAPRRASKAEKEAQAMPSRDHDHVREQQRQGRRLSREAHSDRRTQ